MRWIDKSEVQFIHWLSLRKILQLSVNNSTDDSESSGDHNLEYNPRRHRAFPLSVPAYIPGTSQRSNELEYLTSYNCLKIGWSLLSRSSSQWCIEFSQLWYCDVTLFQSSWHGALWICPPSVFPWARRRGFIVYDHLWWSTHSYN